MLLSRRDTHRLVYFEADGTRLKEVAWSTPAEPTGGRLITDGAGVLVIEEIGLNDGSQLSRVDRDGAILWKMPKAKYLDAVSRGDEIVVLVLDASGEAATILRLANP